MIAGRRIGKQALFLGAAAQMLPDMDFVTAFWMDPTSSIIAHRGFTHSFLFVFLVTLAAPLVAKLFYRRGVFWNRDWILIIGVNLFTHIFLDAFNAYGTGWFEPFHSHRFSFNVLFVADPFFSVGPFIAFLFLLFRNKTYIRRIRWASLGIVWSGVYLAYAGMNKQMIENDVSRIIRQEKINSLGHFTTPTPLNSWLWYVAVKDEKGYYFGYRSVFEKEPRIDFVYFPRNDSLLDGMSNHKEIRQLKQFSKGYYTIENWHDTLVFNVLHFGQVIGWHDPKERFAFHYFLNHNDANKLVVQRGRFAKWNTETTMSLIQRIRGRQTSGVRN